MIRSLRITAISGHPLTVEMAIIAGLEDGTARFARPYAGILKTHLLKALFSRDLEREMSHA